MKYLIALIFFLTLCSSMYSQTKKDSSYFPLAIGNQWIYKFNEGPFFDTVTIVDTQRVNGKQYYAFQKYGGNRYIWFGKDTNRVYIIDTIANRLNTSNVSECMVYDFSAATGESWELSLTNSYLECDYAGIITLVKKNDSIITIAGMFSDCYKFSRSMLPCRDAGRLGEWFAAGIGRVAYSEESIAGIRNWYLLQSNLLTEVVDPHYSHSIVEYNLWQNYPNPFNPGTVISYSLPSTSSVKLIVYNTLGQKVRTLVSEYKNAGNYTINFDAADLTSGIYFYKLEAGQFSQIKKMILLK
jgi:Secretion system C-terminal sorting domain